MRNPFTKTFTATRHSILATVIKGHVDLKYRQTKSSKPGTKSDSCKYDANLQDISKMLIRAILNMTTMTMTTRCLYSRSGYLAHCAKNQQIETLAHLNPKP